MKTYLYQDTNALVQKIYHPIIKDKGLCFLTKIRILFVIGNTKSHVTLDVYLNKMQFCFLHSVMCIQIKKCLQDFKEDRGKSTKRKL